MKTLFGWKYKGTDIRVRLGDKVKVSVPIAKRYGFDRGEVVGLHGFITVLLPNGDRIDLDARQVSLAALNA